MIANKQQSGQVPHPLSGRPCQPAHTVCATVHGACQVIYWKPKSERPINENLAWPAVQCAEQFKHAHQVYCCMAVLHRCGFTPAGLLLAINCIRPSPGNLTASAGCTIASEPEMVCDMKATLELVAALLAIPKALELCTIPLILPPKTKTSTHPKKQAINSL